MKERASEETQTKVAVHSNEYETRLGELWLSAIECVGTFTLVEGPQRWIAIAAPLIMLHPTLGAAFACQFKDETTKIKELPT